jgi:hypothetical protein
VARVRAGAERARDFRADADRRLAAAHTLLDEARAAAADAREAHGTALEKIAGAAVAAPPVVAGDLAAELDRVAALANGGGAWLEADAALGRWTARATALRDDARRAAAANRAPIGERNELRGLLGAYQAKAQRLRLLERPALAQLFERAHRALHTAPTDLGQATLLVREYQRAVSGAPAAREPEGSR